MMRQTKNLKAARKRTFNNKLEAVHFRVRLSCLWNVLRGSHSWNILIGPYWDHFEFA